MKMFALLSLLLVCGCTGQQSEDVTQNSNSSLTAPVIVEAKVVGEEGGSKYYWYKIQPINVIKNETQTPLYADTKVAIRNDLPQPKLDKSYRMELEYYNESNPEYGLKIVKLTEK